jgi:hypothetical protein
MFYCAHASILLLGGLLASGWSTDVRHVLDRQAAHVFRTEVFFWGFIFSSWESPISLFGDPTRRRW